MKAKITLSSEETLSRIDERIYGSFIEHLGRAVYGGIYEPGHPSADECGFRTDVIDLVKNLGVPVVRYPGGNFVSGYHWEDGIGDKSKRPRKMDLAWQSVEPNEVGIDEFQEWAKRAGTNVMMAVNLGTRGPEEARDCLEYCNGTTPTYYADLRRKNGFEEPFGIKLWCLGNEMDGAWQMGAKSPEDYGKIARETAKMMKWTDPSIELVACGSCGPNRPTFGEWERTVLRYCYPHIEYLSLHQYISRVWRGQKDKTIPEFLTGAYVMDGFIKRVVAICDEIKAEKKSSKTINLSFDEWNVWNQRPEAKADWRIGPPLLENHYSAVDAVAVGDMMITLLNNADRVKIACLAQLVNVIAPIMTENGGRAWAQTIYYPFMLTSANGRGTALRTAVDCETYDAQGQENVPLVSAAAVLTDDGKIVVFAVNRSTTEACDLALDTDGYRPVKRIVYTSDDPEAINTADEPDRVLPAELPADGALTLAPLSWNMILLEKA